MQTDIEIAETESALNGRGEPGIFIAPLAARATAFELTGGLGVRLHTPSGAVDIRLAEGAEPVRQAMSDGGQLHVFEVDMPKGDEEVAAEILKAELGQRLTTYVIGPLPRL